MIYQGDCLEVLKTLDSNSIDSMVTDPPAGISFMGKEWDKSDGFIPFMTSIMTEALRVLKPGAHALVWAIPRTSHWTATALENAGFEIRDVITHLFGSGFPKSHNIEKATLDSKFKGWGTALKPASEHWILVRKPLSEKTVAANVLKWGTGGINIDGSRVGLQFGETTHGSGANQGNKVYGDYVEKRVGAPNVTSAQGRFPANLVLSHDEGCELVGSKKVKAIKGGNSTNVNNKVYGKYEAELDKKSCGFGDEDGTETVAAYNCTPTCAVAMLDEQSGTLKSGGHSPAKTYNKLGYHGHGSGANFDYSPSQGGASRFFYCAKASKSDKNAGCEGLEYRESSVGDNRPSGNMNQRIHGIENREEIKNQNHHPTVKSTKLMSYLINLITPVGGIVLDPFMGSGSTGVSAIRERFQFIGIEREPEYLKIARARIDYETELVV